ncbi:hypothetical protein GN956_G13598 [Arapaima gigas]
MLLDSSLQAPDQCLYLERENGGVLAQPHASHRPSSLCRSSTPLRSGQTCSRRDNAQPVGPVGLSVREQQAS